MSEEAPVRRLRPGLERQIEKMRLRKATQKIKVKKKVLDWDSKLQKRHAAIAKASVARACQLHVSPMPDEYR